MAKNLKEDAAFDLYMAGYSQLDIARILKLAKNTISNWSKKNNWVAEKVRLSMLEENSIKDLMEIFEYQVSCLKQQKNEMIASGDTKPFKPGEFDALQKAYSIIKPDFNKFKVYVSVIKQFTEFLQAQDIELTKQVIPFADTFINEKHRLL